MKAVHSGLIHRKAKAEDFLPQQHFHPEYEIDCIISGSGKWQIANQLDHYQNGDTVLIGPNLPHSGCGNKCRRSSRYNHATYQ